MKSVRPLLIGVGVAVVVGTVALGLGLVPGIQRWALLRLVAGRPGRMVAVDHVSIGWHQVELRGVSLVQDGVTTTVARIDFDYSLPALAFGRRLVTQRLAAAGVMVDASRRSLTETTGGATAAPVGPALLERFRLPFGLELDDCRVDGQLLLAGAAGNPPYRAEFKITGGHFAPGAEGALLLAATIRNPLPEEHVGALNAQVSVRASQTAQGTFTSLGLTAVVDAQGKNFSEQNQLKVAASLARDAAGENYSASVDTLIRGTAENVLTIQAVRHEGQNEYSGRWNLKARTAQLEPFFLGGALPEFDARGAGRFVLTPATRAVSLQGRFDAGASKLEAIDPSWRAIGAVNVQVQFDLAAADGVAQLRQLDVRLAGSQPVLELEATQAAEVNFNEHRLRVGGAAAGEALNLKLDGVPLAWVRPFVHAVDLSGGLITGQFSITGDTDRLVLRALQPLQIDDLTVVRQGRALLSNVAVNVGFESVLTAQALETRVGEFTLRTPAGDSCQLQAVVSIPVGPHPPVSVVASYSADLPALLAPWVALGHVKSAGETEFTLADGRIEVRRGNFSLTDLAGAGLFKATALRAFSLDPANWRAAAVEPGSVDLVHFSFGRLPLDFAPVGGAAARLAGVVEQGEFVLTSAGERLTLHPVSAFRVAAITLTRNGRPALSNLALEAQPVLELAGKSVFTASTGEMSVRSADGAPVATGRGESRRTAELGVRGNLTFNLDLPPLAAQPLFAGTKSLAQGHASGEIRLALGENRLVEARLTVNGLVAAETGQTLPVANLSVRWLRQANGGISLQVPLLLDRAGQRSDLSLTADLTPAGGAYAVDGKVTGEHVDLADALAVGGVFFASAARAEAAPVAAESAGGLVADSLPAWSRFTGRLALDLKSVTRGKDWSMTAATGLVLIAPTSVTLQQLDAAFGEKSRFTAKGVVNFSAGAEPYRLAGDFSLTEFDAGRLFKAIEPAKPATIEGLFAVTGRLSSTGGTVGRMLARTQGQLDLSSRQGTFRGLQRTSNKISMTSKAIELGASVFGSIFGSEKVTKAAEKVAGQAYFLDQLAQNVGDFTYDQFSFRLVRDESLNVTLTDISLVSPDIHLLGKGTVTHVPDKPLLEQPLSVSLSLAGRGKTELLLGKLHQLDGSRDELGYARTALPVTISGTPAKPDPSAFFTAVVSAKLAELTAPEGN